MEQNSVRASHSQTRLLLPTFWSTMPLGLLAVNEARICLSAPHFAVSQPKDEKILFQETMCLPTESSFTFEYKKLLLSNS